MEKHYTLILAQNGTQIQLMEGVSTTPLVPGIFLTLHFALGLGLNVTLILGMATSTTLRGINFNRLLLQLALACALDCFLNVAAAVAFLAVTHLELSSKYAKEVLLACRLNAALMEWIAVTQGALLAALVTDRAIALHQESKSDNNNNNRGSCVIRTLSVLLWLYAGAIVAPIAVTSSIVSIHFFPYRYSCGVMPKSESLEDLLYPFLLLVLGYVIPWLITTLGSLRVVRHILAARRRRRQLEEAGLSRSQRLQQTSFWIAGITWDQVIFYWLVSALLLCFVVLLLPHDLYVNISSLIFSVSSKRLKTEPASGNKSTEITEMLTGSIDCVFVWCRYSFTVIAPLMVLAMHKEVRKSCEHLFCCTCRNNAVVHLEDARSISACVQKRMMEHESKKKINLSIKKIRGKKDKYKRAASYRTPVLFATSEGLHLRLVDDDKEEYYTGNYEVMPTSSRDKQQCWSTEPRFICEFCDNAILTPASLESGSNPSNILQQSFVGRRPKPPVFTPEILPEEDLHVTDSSGEYATRVLPSKQESNHARKASNMNNNHRKVPRVRFAQTVSEIPLSESGVWSSPEDHNLISEQSMNGKTLLPPERHSGMPS